MIDVGPSLLAKPLVGLIEATKNATYIGDFCLITKSGGWSESPSAIFYNENPPDPTFSKYFGMHYRAGSLYITDGASAFRDLITGVVADNGDVIYSRYRHDYRTSKDGSVWIDGGRDYTRSGAYEPGRFVQLQCVKDKLVIV